MFSGGYGEWSLTLALAAGPETEMLQLLVCLALLPLGWLVFGHVFQIHHFDGLVQALVRIKNRVARKNRQIHFIFVDSFGAPTDFLFFAQNHRFLVFKSRQVLELLELAEGLCLQLNEVVLVHLEHAPPTNPLC